MGRPKGSKKYAGERKSFNVLLPTAYIEAIDKLGDNARPRKPRAQVATEIVMLGLLARHCLDVVQPILQSTDLGADPLSLFANAMTSEFEGMAQRNPDWFDHIGGLVNELANENGLDDLGSEPEGSYPARKAS